MKEMAQQVLDLIAQGGYQIEGHSVRFAEQQQAAVQGTCLYRPDDFERLFQALSHPVSDQGEATDVREDSGSSPQTARDTTLPNILVTEGTTQAVAQQMAREASDESGSAPSLALLNFASARNPGGGFLNGAKAQEEDLCRCSGLYPCLLQCMEYYEVNRQQKSMLYTDHAIFSPGVPFFKVRSTGELLPQPFYPAVITAPAPNTGPHLKRNPGDTESLRATFERRWKMVMAMARHQGVTRLLLGAWGCGAFQGDPQMAAETALESIQCLGHGFAEIVFAIPGKGRRSQANLDVFRQVLTP